MEGLSISQLSRRKACDLCFVKKIKCDMIKPHCSNCKQYGAECKTTHVRRRAGQSKPKPAATTSAGVEVSPESDNTASQEKISSLETRLVRIEQQLQQVLHVASAAMMANKKNNPNTMPIDPALTTTEPSSLEDITTWLNQVSTTSPSATSSSSIESNSTIIRSLPPTHKLPPIESILPIIDHFFTHINPLIPLFTQSTMTRLLNEWYTFPSRRNNATWAAINIILALSTRLPASPIPGMHYFDSETSAPFGQYLCNAQSVLSELVTRDQDLLGLQALLGLVLLYQSLPDPRPGTVLIGAAVRLVHRLKMQSRDTIRVLYPAEEGLHRTRLFWIAYLLDKEISLRHHTPSMQLDADIDLDLPELNPGDGVGDIWSLDGRTRVNYFRLRVRLAHIHGRIYDLLYSNRSSKISKGERQGRVVRLSWLLENWRRELPEEMQPKRMRESLGRWGIVAMGSLFCSWVACMILVHGVWSYQAEWVKRVESYKRVTMHKEGEEGSRCCTTQNPPLPSAWKRCVQISRECLRLMSGIPQSDGNIWFNASALFSSAVVVLSNIREFPGHEDLEEDKKVTRYTLGLLEKIREKSVLVPIQQLQSILDELDRNAFMAIQAAQEKVEALRNRLLGAPGVLIPPRPSYMKGFYRAFRTTQPTPLTRHLFPRTILLPRPFSTTTSHNMAQEYKLKGVTSLDLKPGEKQEVEVEGLDAKVLLLNAGGTVQATGPRCTHYGAPLVKGVLGTNGKLTCPWHGACFNAKTGDVEDAPALDALPVFKTTLRDGAVYITGEVDTIKAGHRKPKFKCKAVGGDKVVVVGGGSGALGTVEGLRENGYEGPITVISNEGYYPIDRPKLSKALLTDLQKLQWRDEEWYKSGSVEFVQDEVTGVDFATKTVSVKSGGKFAYTKLVLATGGTPRVLSLQGFKVLDNIFTLRNVRDAENIKKAIGEKGKKIVIIGSSFIGMELAVATSKDNSVTVVGMEKVPLERVLGEKVGAIIQKGVEGKGVKFYMSAGVEKAEPSGSDPAKVGSVVLKDGTTLEADLVILGVGVAPATEYLKDNSVLQLEQDGSLKVDEYFSVVGLKDVYAIGDIATYPYHGPASEGKYVRIEHWNVAQKAGRIAAGHITNQTKAGLQSTFFSPVFWSALHAQLRYTGNTQGSGFDDVVIQGNPDEGKWIAYYTKGDTVVAMSSMGADPAMAQFAQLLELGKLPSKKELQDGLDILSLGPPQ
ncbi:apoptosis-inducing factor 1 [Podospora fimiseda]|uniref:Apoptosis-inducing factor 1 n=1 Tax=Podospora fimiseda TaxID=252190 RepID=A0AAN7BGS2_9PEZI|nr:apoptosis-inducing factor 1 [Podospora fimiseda]